MKPIDKSKKSNIKCEHCGHYADWPVEKCVLTDEEKNYWQRCKSFKWREDREYIESTIPPASGVV